VGWSPADRLPPPSEVHAEYIVQQERGALERCMNNRSTLSPLCRASLVCTALSRAQRSRLSY